MLQTILNLLFILCYFMYFITPILRLNRLIFADEYETKFSAVCQKKAKT